MQGPGTHAVNATPVPVIEGVVYELTAPASGGAALHWEVEVSAGDETWVERDGYGIDGKQPSTDTIAGVGVSVRVWRAPVDGVARFSVVIDGAATVTAATVAGRTGRVILTVPGDVLAENIMASGGLIAGDPDGARVVIDAEGVVAFDGSGTETAQITGEGGEFVGGSFRTSDNLPGQVLLADDAYVDAGSQNTYPGIRITPPDMSELVSPPGMGPNANGFVITGGRNITGGRAFSTYSPDAGEMRFVKGSARSNVSVRDGEAWVDARDANGNHGYIQTKPGFAIVRSDAADGSAGAVQATSSSAVVATLGPGGDYMSQIRSNGREAFMWSTGSDGLGRILSVDSDGIWVKTNRDGSWKHYNLEETAQDSGWQTFDLEPGVTGSQAVAWRNKGGVIYFRGFVTGDWTTGVWNTIASGLNPDWCPSETWVVAEAGGATKGATLQMTADGRLRISPPVTSTTSYYLNAMTYPAG